VVNINLEKRVGKMIKKVLILPDVHIDTSISREYKTVKKFMVDFKPDETILLGDFADVSALSAWDLDKKRLMEGRRFKLEMNKVNEELDYVQKYSKKVTYLEGNHEFRVGRYLDKNPEMEGLIEIETMLNLDKRNIDYKPMNELYKLGNMYFTHGMWINKYHANAHLTRLGCNICYGHGHRPQTDSMNMKMQIPHAAYGLGCLCDKAPDYLKGRPSNWTNQFAVMYSDTKTGNYNMYPINIIKGSFIFGGKKYKSRK